MKAVFHLQRPQSRDTFRATVDRVLKRADDVLLRSQQPGEEKNYLAGDELTYVDVTLAALVGAVLPTAITFAKVEVGTRPLRLLLHPPRQTRWRGRSPSRPPRLRTGPPPPTRRQARPTPLQRVPLTSSERDWLAGEETSSPPPCFCNQAEYAHFAFGFSRRSGGVGGGVRRGAGDSRADAGEDHRGGVAAGALGRCWRAAADG
mmetsp:Transcript_8226/g.26963  ORF Transcript_8226/g.26963 Transcript_8226/m.26963 type:complete len:204 (-) Transcript_8226:1275-1886(-)